MDIDSFTSLILSIYNNKGVYALLLGSGVSLEAKIMSGWKVTEDLIKKVAVVMGEDIPTDAFAWYKNKFGFEADYSKKQLKRQKGNSAVIKSGMFEGNFDLYMEALDKVNEIEELAYGRG